MHTYIRMHSVVGDDTRLSKLLAANQGLASSIKYQLEHQLQLHFLRSTPSMCMARILQASDRLTIKRSVLFLSHSQSKNLLHCTDKAGGARTNLGHSLEEHSLVGGP